ncbi:MAG: PhzF family phenazine biosynthesis protein [Acidimicrobiia bacterium]
MTRPCHVLRVFTRGDDGGNHLGVINDVVGVSDEQMQETATELGFSETIYVDWTDPHAAPSVRIFTPGGELPFAGHPLVGAAWVLSMLGPGAGNTISTEVGDVGFDVDGDASAVTCDIEISVILPDNVAEVAAAAGLPAPISTMCLGLPKEYLIAEYATHDDISALDPDMDALRDHFGLLVYARHGHMVNSRFFVPGHGVPEDPATGSAAVALARSFMLRGEPTGAVTVHQGDEIGHPSTINVAWDSHGIRIGGTVRRDKVVQVR